jgi:hypothetical protein
VQSILRSSDGAYDADAKFNCTLCMSFGAPPA